MSSNRNKGGKSSRDDQQQHRSASTENDDVESPFERESHSFRYTSHVRDVDRNQDSEEERLSASPGHRQPRLPINSRSTANATVEWLLRESHHDDDQNVLANEDVDLDDDDDASSQSSGMSNIWQQRQQHTGMAVDQSINLMDSRAAPYMNTDEPDPGEQSVDTFRDGLQNLYYKPPSSISSSVAPATTRNRPTQNPDAAPSWAWFLGGQKRNQKHRSNHHQKRTHRVTSQSNQTTAYVPTKDDMVRRTLIGSALVLTIILATVVILSLRLMAEHHHHNNHHKPGTQPAAYRDHDSWNPTENSKAVVQNEKEPDSLKDSTSQAKGPMLASSPPPPPPPPPSSRQYEVSHDHSAMIHPTVSLPTKSRQQAITAILVEYQVSNPDRLFQDDDFSTPQFRAVQWISQHDPAHMPLPSAYYTPPPLEEENDGSRKLQQSTQYWEHGSEEFMVQQLIQRYALAVFYFGLEPAAADMDATEHLDRFQSSWLSEDHVCHWHGLDCGVPDVRRNHDDRKAATSPETNKMESVHLSTVVSVNLTRHYLNGTGNAGASVIPTEWFSGNALSDLASIDLSYNYLRGTIPASRDIETALSNTDSTRISTSQGDYYLQFKHTHNRNGTAAAIIVNHPALVYLDLSHNQLSGVVPPILQEWKDLSTLRLNHNQLAGPVESLLGNSDKAVDQNRIGKFEFSRVSKYDLNAIFFVSYSLFFVHSRNSERGKQPSNRLHS